MDEFAKKLKGALIPQAHAQTDDGSQSLPPSSSPSSKPMASFQTPSGIQYIANHIPDSSGKNMTAFFINDPQWNSIPNSMRDARMKSIHQEVLNHYKTTPYYGGESDQDGYSGYEYGNMSNQHNASGHDFPTLYKKYQ